MTGVKRIMRKEDEWGESNRRDQIDMGVETHVEARPHVQSRHSQSLTHLPCLRVVAFNLHHHLVSISFVRQKQC
jgi:hypothetical protein